MEQLFFNSKAKGSEVERIYSIIKQNFEPEISSSRFPDFYGYLNGVMILYYFPYLPFQELCLDGKKKLIENLQPYLNSKEHIIAKDEEGNVIIDDKNFREESYNLHGGIQLKILANGEYIIEK